MNVVVVGSGKLGQRHLQMWSNIKGVNIVGVIARNKERLEKVAKEFKTNFFLSIEEAVQYTHIDIVDICTPTHTHVELIKEAARMKKHVICEKPLALTKKEAEKALTVCQDHHVQMYVGHTLRFFPQYARARELIQKRMIGKADLVQLERGATRPITGWYSDYDKSGGLFLDLGIHDLDWLLWTLGDVQEVMAKEVKNTSRQLTYGLASLKMKNGSMATIKLSWEEEEFYSAFEAAGSKGLIAYDMRKNGEALELQVYQPSKEGASVRKKIQTHTNFEDENPFQRQLEHFLNCIKGNESPIVTPEEAIKAVELGEALIKAAKEGKSIVLDKG